MKENSFITCFTRVLHCARMNHFVKKLSYCKVNNIKDLEVKINKISAVCYFSKGNNFDLRRCKL